MGASAKINEIELIEDFIEFMDLSPDATYINDDVKKEAQSIPLGTLIEVEKQIASPIKILSVKEVTDDSIKKGLR